MEMIKTQYPTLATCLFMLAILLAHLFSPSEYQWTKNTISDLGAQGYDKKAIMQIGFLLFGLILVAGVILNGSRWPTTPILLYGFSVALTGIFCTAPFLQGIQHSSAQATLHSIFAQLAGVAFCIGILTQYWFAADSVSKITHIFFFLLVMVLSASFGIFKDQQGIMQRLLYLASFVWLVKYYRP
jgi:hypothetical membrane protein